MYFSVYVNVNFEDVLLVDFVDLPLVFKDVTGFFHEGDSLQPVWAFLACITESIWGWIQLNCFDCSLENFIEYESKCFVSHSDTRISKMDREYSTFLLAHLMLLPSYQEMLK